MKLPKEFKHLPKNISKDFKNIIEKILSSCYLLERRVPTESNRAFQISEKLLNEDICVIYLIDRGHNGLEPIVPDHQIKPDYLVFYVKKNLCIGTIIEMKGMERKNLKHGVDQIIYFKKLLEKNIREYLPTKFKIHFQGIILTHPLCEIPVDYIVKKNKIERFTITTFEHIGKFDLKDYVSKKITIGEQYNHIVVRNISENKNFIEKILMGGFDNKRKILDDYSRKYCKKTKSYVYLNFQSELIDNYGSLYCNYKDSFIGLPNRDLCKSKKSFMNSLSNGLSPLEFNNIFKFESLEN
ncbi:MAG: hypothetical protein KDC42_07680 [Ignavibacteriae bacterium]|nr:hypothetical protein [Ignavibacteriota bacterium]